MKPNYHNYYKRFDVFLKKPATRISGLISLTFFTVAFFLIFAILPTLTTITQLQKEIKDSQTVNSQLYKKTLNLQTAENNYAKIINDLGLINNILPEKEAFEKLSWQIQWLAQQKGVEVVSGSFEGFKLIGQQLSGIKSLEVELTANGNYLQIKDWLNTLTNIDRLITIQSFSLSTKNLKLSKESTKITATIKLNAYYLSAGEQ